MRGLGFDHSGRSQQWIDQAGGIAARMDKKQPTQGKSAGGALMSGASMAMAGAKFGSAVPVVGTAVGAVAGFAGGLGAYLLS